MRLLVLALVFVALPVAAQVLIPPDLSTGESYRLVYVTSDTRNALSTDIADYDAFVQATSDAGDIGVGSPIGDISWEAIGSTAFVDAIDHVAGAGPIYRLDGVRVSDSAADLWDGGIDVPINVTEELMVFDVAVYTGTDVDGFGAFAGITPVRLGDSSARLGDSGETDMDWVETGFFSSSAIGRAFYGISETLTVPPPTVPAAPIFGAWFLFGVVGGSAYLVMRRARAAGAAAQ